MIILVMVLIYFCFKLFWPTTYNVQLSSGRDSTEYWDLKTGSRIAYTFLPAKDSAKPPFPIIYLHGGPGAGITDREIETYAMLADSGYNVYLYDQIGCGYSGRLANIEEYTAERHKQDLLEIVKTIGSEKVILVGQSWGSILATRFVADHTELVEKIIITAPAPIQPARKELETVSPPDTLNLQMPPYSNKKANESVASMRSNLVRWAARKYGIKLAGDTEADAFATYFTSVLNKGMVCDTANAVVAEGSEGLYVHYITLKSLAKLQDQRSILKSLNTPVLVMKAQCDNQPWGYTTEYLDIFRNHEFRYIKNAGHNIFLEQPDVYVNTIIDFLR